MSSTTQKVYKSKTHYSRIPRIAALLFFLALLSALSFVPQKNARAQTAQAEPYMFLTWSTDTYVPLGYRGRALPVANSPLRVTLDVIEGGRRVDLSPYIVRWYLGETFFTAGKGLNSITTYVPDVTGTGIVKVRAQINDYKQTTIIKIVNIPVVTPETVISAPHSSSAVSGSSILFEGIPYFFNTKFISDLSFEWLVNGKRAEEGDEASADPNFLLVSFNESGSRGTFSVRLFIRNIKASLESAQKSTSFTYAP